MERSHHSLLLHRLFTPSSSHQPQTPPPVLDQYRLLVQRSQTQQETRTQPPVQRVSLTTRSHQQFLLHEQVQEHSNPVRPTPSHSHCLKQQPILLLVTSPFLAEHSHHSQPHHQLFTQSFSHQPQTPPPGPDQYRLLVQHSPIPQETQTQPPVPPPSPTTHSPQQFLLQEPVQEHFAQVRPTPLRSHCLKQQQTLLLATSPFLVERSPHSQPHHQLFTPSSSHQQQTPPPGPDQYLSLVQHSPIPQETRTQPPAPPPSPTTHLCQQCH